jgi:hypothetical protein
VAQLGARLDGIEEVVGSNPIGSTNFVTTSYHVHIPPNKALGISRDWANVDSRIDPRIGNENPVVSNNGCDILHIWRSKEGRMATIHQPAGIAWKKPADLSSKDAQRRLSPAAVKAFLKVRELWGLRDEDARQLLGGISNGAFYELKRKARGALDQDRLTRISILTGIFKALYILYSKKLADRWIQLPNDNPMFEGATPLTYMMKGGLPAMLRVRQLLDARRGG